MTELVAKPDHGTQLTDESGQATISFQLYLDEIQQIVNAITLSSGVISVNTQTGIVVLTTTNINEGTNLYFTDARVNANANVIANTAKVSNANHTGAITGSTVTALGSFTVGQLSTAISDATLSGNNTGDELPASLTVAGVIEIATVVETNTGTDATRSVSPDGLDGWTGSAQLTTLGTIGTGIWQGAAINQTFLVGQSGTNTGDEVAASTTVSGISELATGTEIDTGTDNTRTITPFGLAGSTLQSNVTTNNAKVTNATHTGDVTGATALTIAAKAVDVAMLADGTDGELITWNASAEAATVPTGTSTHVLTSNGAGTAPTFQPAPGAGSGSLIKISSGSESNQVTVDFINLSSLYAAYELTFWNLVPVTDATSLNMRTDNDTAGGSFDAGASDYSHIRFVGRVGGTLALQGSDAASEIQLTGGGAITGLSNVAADAASGTITLIAPAIDATQTQIQCKMGYTAAGGNQALMDASGKRISSATIGAFQLLMSSGNISTMDWVLHARLA